MKIYWPDRFSRAPINDMPYPQWDSNPQHLCQKQAGEVVRATAPLSQPPIDWHLGPCLTGGVTTIVIPIDLSTYITTTPNLLFGPVTLLASIPYNTYLLRRLGYLPTCLHTCLPRPAWMNWHIHHHQEALQLRSTTTRQYHNRTVRQIRSTTNYDVHQ